MTVRHDEESLQRKPRSEFELLEAPPGLANRLGRALGAEDSLAGGVLHELREPVRVDRRLLRADRHGDQVAIPGCELLEGCQKLLALGPPLRPPDPLLRLPR